MSFVDNTNKGIKLVFTDKYKEILANEGPESPNLLLTTFGLTDNGVNYLLDVEKEQITSVRGEGDGPTLLTELKYKIGTNE